MTSVGTNYSSNVTKIFPIDQDHWVGTQEITGIRLDDSGKGPFHMMTTHIVLILYGDKSGVRLHGYCTFMDKDGDKVMADCGLRGVGFPEGTGRTICREVWKFTLKTPL